MSETKVNYPTEMYLGPTFCGFRATQVWQDYYLWEYVLNRHATNLVGIVELGTACGGFALYLAMQAKYRGLEFATFDCVDPVLDPTESLFGRPVARPPIPPLPWFQKVDLLNKPAREVRDRLDHGPVILFCDNGHKAEEVFLYGPYLEPGSLCIVHDWKSEIFPKDIPDYLSERYGDLCDELDSWSRVFERESFSY